MGAVITTIFPRIYSRTYYAHPRSRGAEEEEGGGGALGAVEQAVARMQCEGIRQQPS